jgi:transcriptional regulator with XRE-family HTH domain
LEDLKVITASNIINLRTAKGMTQAELGELLSYSDKSVSKWERAEAVPDAYVLKKMSEIFGVSVDYTIVIPLELFNRNIVEITVPIRLISQFRLK